MDPKALPNRGLSGPRPSTRQAVSSKQSPFRALTAFLSPRGGAAALGSYQAFSTAKLRSREEELVKRNYVSVTESVNLAEDQNDILQQLVNEFRRLRDNDNGVNRPSTNTGQSGSNVDVDVDVEQRKKKGQRGRFGSKARERLRKMQRAKVERDKASRRQPKVRVEPKVVIPQLAPQRVPPVAEKVTAPPQPTRPSPSPTEGTTATREVSRDQVRQRVSGKVRRAMGQMALTKFPVLGAVVGLFFGAQRASAGDYLGAGAEVASGIIGSFPGLGTVASLGIDSALLARDLYRDAYEVQIEDDPHRSERLQVLQGLISEMMQEIVSAPQPTPRLPTVYNDDVRQQISELLQHVTGNEELSSMIGHDVIVGLRRFIRSAPRAISGEIAETTRENMRRELARLQSAILRATPPPAPTRSADELPTRALNTTELLTDTGTTEFNELNFEADTISFDGAIKLPGSLVKALRSVAPTGGQSPVVPASFRVPAPSSGGRVAAPMVRPAAIGGGGAGATTSGAGTGMAMSPPVGGGDMSGGSGDFMSEVNRVADKFSLNPTDLLALMRSESGINPAAVNSSTGATGLIQFMPATARSLGTTTEELRGMSAAEQMKYVERFFESVRLPSGASAGQLYAYVFLPGRARREVLTAAGEPFYEQNRGLDMDKDGQITIADLDARMARFGGSGSRVASAPSTGVGLVGASSGMVVADQAQAMGTGRSVQVSIPTPTAVGGSGQGLRLSQTSREVPLNRRLEQQVL